MIEDSLVEVIVYELWCEILCGNLLFGVIIKECDNVEWQGVLCIFMCEVICILVKEGLVQLCLLCSFIVVNFLLVEIIDQICVLYVLEMLLGELVCEYVIVEDIQVIGVLKDRIEMIYGEVDMLDVFELDMQFYVVIVVVVYNGVFVEIYVVYMVCLWWVCYLLVWCKLFCDCVLCQYNVIYVVLVVCDIGVIKIQIGVYLGVMVENIEDYFCEEMGKEDG